MKNKLALCMTAVALAGSLLAIDASAQIYVEAPNAPPPPRVEVVPGPRAGFVWDAGHWQWTQGRYVWRRGHWQAARGAAHWEPGHWQAFGARWRWMPGHWV